MSKSGYIKENTDFYTHVEDRLAGGSKREIIGGTVYRPFTKWTFHTLINCRGKHCHWILIANFSLLNLSMEIGISYGVFM